MHYEMASAWVKRSNEKLLSPVFFSVALVAASLPLASADGLATSSDNALTPVTQSDNSSSLPTVAGIAATSSFFDKAEDFKKNLSSPALASLLASSDLNISEQISENIQKFESTLATSRDDFDKARAHLERIDVTRAATMGDLLHTQEETVVAITEILEIVGNLTKSSLSSLSTQAGLSEALGTTIDTSTLPWGIKSPSYTPVDVDVDGHVMAGSATASTVAGAVNQLSDSVRHIAGAAVKYDGVSDKTRLTLNPNAASTTLANVAPGALSADSLEAVNGSQLFYSNAQIEQMGTELEALADHSTSAIADIKRHAGQRVEDVRLVTSDLSKGLGKVSNEVAILQNDLNNSNAASVKYDDPTAKTQVTMNPSGSAVTLTNLAAGAISATSSDAITGSQLFSSSQQIEHVSVELNAFAAHSSTAIAEAKRHADQQVNKLGSRIEEVKSAASNLSKGYESVNNEVARLQSGAAGAFRMNDSGNTKQPAAEGISAVAGGNGARATGDGSVAIGTSAKSSANNAIALGNNALVTADNSTALGPNSVADRADSVSVGRLDNERQIANVAPGVRRTDAVNVSQLNRSTVNAVQNANTYTDQRNAEIRRDLDRQDSTLSAGIAGAMAMASLPRSMVAGGGMTSVAAGNYRGESAIALGISYVSDDGRWSSNLLGTTNTKNDTGVAVGMGYQW